ncbi:hypothetical protein FA15DRAFT_666153 [Coprinopsis marcescibilis]|uniref:CENP-V/GFA domain-containing protein n=1 Tax=Coprinopsis marcescibilis TaxID=230819 RepID=A0A5C3L3W7_COPMA|nr:hypothetical protein FA15DRAFT_666153 [Coprinopsis marcescibilis]
MTTLIKAECYCGSNKFKVPLKTAELPTGAAMCHCNSCRHATGATNVVDISFDGHPLSPEATDANGPPGDISNFTQYKSSSGMTRYFCSKCSCKMFFKGEDHEGKTQWYVSSAVLEKIDGVQNLATHIWVGDTVDGGAAAHVPRFAGKTLPRFKESRGQEEVAPDYGTNTIGSPPTDSEKDSALRFYCHCKGVEFYLKRATEIKDPEKEWWLAPGKACSDPIRFTTEHCLCTSCRLTSGAMLPSWTFVPNTHVLDARTMEPINLTDAEKRPPTLQQFESSPNVHREFCRTCGANVFYWKPGNAPRMDIATGLLDHEQAGGARANTWLKWSSDSVGYEQDAFSQEWLQAVMEGIKSEADL